MTLYPGKYLNGVKLMVLISLILEEQGKPNQHYGVRDYKLKFGGKLVNFGRYEIVHKKHLFKIGKIGYYLFKKI